MSQETAREEKEEIEPLHPGDFILARLAELGMSQSECALRMGISTKHLNQICIHKIHAISPRMALLFERVLGIEMRHFLIVSGEYEIHLVREQMRLEEGASCEIEEEGSDL